MKCSTFSQYIREAFSTHEIALLLEKSFGPGEYTDKQIQVYLQGVEAGAHASFHSMSTMYAGIAGTMSLVHSALSDAVTDAARNGRKEDHDVIKSALDSIDQCHNRHVAQNIALYTIEITKDWAVPAKYLGAKRVAPTDGEAEAIASNFASMNQFKAMAFLSHGPDGVAKMDGDGLMSFIGLSQLNSSPSFTMPQLGQWVVSEARKAFDELSVRASAMFEVDDDHGIVESETSALMNRIMGKGTGNGL